ncbi:MAG: SPOR domain-containing protein [Deltaproteobacteria bacterium]|nr:SPOR domain-containing protein [Deltaproteobacteria bacterium]MBI2341531.1 SPOR domain-containing protein [Deltaproteobacteria bacterium]MBI2974130.1 SPOR domain-containing protein [Deltaproteobacteria bacterium]
MNEFRDLKNLKEDDDLQYFCKFTFGQFFTILVLEVVTLAFVFYLGAKYGTNYLKIDGETGPNITQVIAGNNQPMAPELQDRELQAMARDVVQGGGTENLKDRVKELLDKEKNPKPAVEAAPAPVQPAVTAVPPAAETATAETTPTEASASSNEAAKAAPSESGVIRMKSPVGSQYSIQVGSYPNMDEAAVKVDDWRNKGYPSFMMIADIPDRGRWYRVRIGGFATKEDAQGYLDKFKQNENVEAIVVLNEQ